MLDKCALCSIDFQNLFWIGPCTGHGCTVDTELNADNILCITVC
jgi:hypothetical protein